MDLRQTEVVVAVADTGGYMAAAPRLHGVQSAVPGTIRALERERGKLLVRPYDAPRRSHEAGESFVPAARVTVGTMQGVSAGSTTPWPRCALSIRVWSCSCDRRPSRTSGRHCRRAR